MRRLPKVGPENIQHLARLFTVDWSHWTENTNLRRRITVWLLTCLFCLHSAALFMLYWHHLSLFGQIQSSQPWGQLYSDTSPYGECSLHRICRWWSSSQQASSLLVWRQSRQGLHFFLSGCSKRTKITEKGQCWQIF